ncbi:DUF502 domain-containing protein [Haloferax sulfurifontis]|uniref:DUF502 domain-containing protein n=1 Tax=Haloferax sulfurifontis ATCC BAA-897 TaxID=662480 RepID=M0IMG0_9EURY|nr:hypothetical protein C441_03909 [Haloferax sulfurifontis ATCC BAA-897]
MSVLSESFVKGSAIIVPLLILIGLLWWVYSVLNVLFAIESIESPALRGLVTAVLPPLVILSIGSIMRTQIGRVVDQTIHNWINRLPVVRVIYNAVKTTLDVLLNHSNRSPRVVRITAWNGSRMLAFDTGNRTADGRVVVFIPGSPEVTSGFVAEIPPESLIECDQTVLTALVRLLSGGFAEPDSV